MIPWLPPGMDFPAADQALTEPNGLLAAGGDLSSERLLAAYRRGIFPWFSVGQPILWWCPDPRMVLDPGAMKITRSLAKVLRNAEYSVRLDSAFARVIRACAGKNRPGQSGTWIVPQMQKAYQRLHELGYAHSVETWRNEKLVGGLYGVAIGGMFFGESMFSEVRDASKIALAHLCHFLIRQGFGIIDCQMETTHLASLGARPLPREEFLRRVSEHVENGAKPGRWPIDGIDGVFRRNRE